MGSFRDERLRSPAGPARHGGMAQHVLTIIAVEHFDKSAAFYKAAFGWAVTVETPVYVEFLLPGGQRFGIYEREGFGKNTGQVPAKVPAGELSPVEVYLHSDDLEAAIKRMVAAGARALSPLSLRPWGGEAA